MAETEGAAQGLEDDVGGGKPSWNRLTSREVDHVLSAAREMPELSRRSWPRGSPTTWGSRCRSSLSSNQHKKVRFSWAVDLDATEVE